MRTRVGHSFIKQVMAETGACFGGEHSGHYYFRDNYRADSGIIAALVVLEVLSSAPATPLSELRKPFERYAASGEINTGRPRSRRPSSRRWPPTSPTADQDRLDGLTVDLTRSDAGDWWFNLRPSNTEPLLRLNLEAADPDGVRRHVAEVQALITDAAGSRPEARPDPRGVPMALDPQLLEILACPEDKGPLLYFADERCLYNPRLKRRYDVRDDIPIMLVDEATTVDDAEHERLVAKAEAEGIGPDLRGLSR